MTAADEIYDVAVIGYGPTGQALTAMLVARGHRVVVVERWTELFPLPRAGHVDHEVMRILQEVGVAEAIERDSWKLTGYELRDSRGDVLHSFEWGHEALSGWYSDYSLFQPQLEGLMHDVVASSPHAELLRGWAAEHVEQDADGVTVAIREGIVDGGDWSPTARTETLRARYLVGCDGANSIVRDTFAMSWTDYGFESDWLVVFVEPHDPTMKIDMPDVAQLLDPARPTTAFRSSGKRFCRWEFMLLPGETAESMSAPEVAWDLIERWGLHAGNSRLVRNTVFRFRSRVVDDFRAGRAFVVGDAAHLMPPFLGQGLCSGLRDAITLAWKLHLVLGEVADPALLATYSTERRPHAASIVEASLRLGEIISVIDPMRAAERDERLRAGTLTPPAPMPDLVDGVLLRDEAGKVRAPAGSLSIQARVRAGDRTGRFDDVAGGGWVVLTTGWAAGDELSEDALALLRRIDARLVRVEAAATSSPGVVLDVDGAYGPWLADLGADAVIVRPDFYLFGAVRGPRELEDALEQLRAGLAIRPAAPLSRR